MRIAVVAASVMGAFAALYFWLPALNRQLDELTIPVGPVPNSSGKYAAAYVTADLPLVLDSAGAVRNVAVGFWYPVEAGRLRTQTPPSRQGMPPETPLGVSNGNTPMSDDRTAWPVIVYAPGWDGSKADNALLNRELASHGYVVAALDDIGTDARALKRNGIEIDDAASTGVDFSSPDRVARTQAVAERRVHLMVEKMQRLLDGLSTEAGMAIPGQLAGRLELARVGIVGFSIGGSAAAEATLHDTRFVAAVNLDGWLIGKALRSRIRVAFLTFNSDLPQMDSWLKSKDLGKRTTALLTVQDRALQREQAKNPTSYMLFFKDVEHGDFTDSLFTPSIKSYLKKWRRTSEDRRRLWQLFMDYQVAFFERYLRGNTSKLPILDADPTLPQVSRLTEPKPS